MKYRLLSKEQFEALHQEFSTFLAVQEVDKNEWEMLKAENSKRVDEYLQTFSDMVWDDVLDRTEYMEHFSEQSINLFYCKEETIERIVVQVNNSDINLLTSEGYEWLLSNSNNTEVEYLKGEKSYSKERNQELFSLIEQGAELSNGNLFNALDKITQ
jgi:hypothetical protein